MLCADDAEPLGEVVGGGVVAVARGRPPPIVLFGSSGRFAPGSPSRSTTFGAVWTCGHQALGGDTCLDGSPLNLSGEVLILLVGIREIGLKSFDVVLEPCDSRSLGLDLTVSGSQSPTELLLGLAGLAELVAELANEVPRSSELIAVLECHRQPRWFGLASLAGAEGADTVGVGAPHAWPTALARDRHADTVTERNETVHPRVIVCEGDIRPGE
jgi:hypothetical protein